MPDRPVGFAEALAADPSPMNIHFDTSCSTGLRLALAESPSLFVQSEPSRADTVIFGTDDITYLDQSPLFRSFRAKSMCITETDIPTFRIPGLYAANAKSVLTSSRARTISYFISERERGNPEVRRLIGRQTEKRYLYSFMGGSNSWARKRIFRSIRSSADALVEATDSYNHWQANPDDPDWRAKQMRRYAEVMAASKFSLCPRGCGLSSYRLFESMSLGVAPVIISDKWRPIEHIDWSFAIFVKESQIPRIDRIVRSHESEWEQRGKVGLDTYNRLLASDVVARMLHGNMTEVMKRHSPVRESIMGPVTRARAANRNLYWVGYRLAKHAILWAYHLSGRQVPIRLNRPVDIQLNRAAPAKRNLAG